MTGDLTIVQSSLDTKIVLSGNYTIRDSMWFIASTSIPVTLLAIFTLFHVMHWHKTGSFTGLAFGLQEAILVALFLARRRPKYSNNSLATWIPAIVGSWGLLLLQPSGTSLLASEVTSLALQFTGAGISVIATLFLGRSFGIVAANRGVKTEGAYRIVRHPIYASYLLSIAGYLIASFSIWNVIVIAVAVGCQLRRIYAEEAVLMKDATYRAYVQRVRHRLVPGLY